MHIGPERGLDTDAAEPLAPKALAADRQWESSESLLPELGSVAGSPGPAQPRPREHTPFHTRG